MSESLPGIAGEIEDIIGLELTVALLRRRGGCEIKIPAKSKNTVLAQIIGEEAVEKLRKEFGAVQITLPCANFRGSKARRSEAKALLLKGHSVSQVALACDLHTRTIHRYRAELDQEAEERGEGAQMRFDL